MTEQRNWLEVDEVKRQFERAALYVADGAAFSYRGMAAGLLEGESWSPQLDSPLEAIFMLWWAALAELNSVVSETVYLETQYECVAGSKSYRLDFVLRPSDDGFAQRLGLHGIQWPRIGVEVDGHAFHEKTQEQVTQRNRRDRDLQHDGWKIFHYSWTEIVRDPANTVGEVFLCARDTYNAVSRELWRVEHPDEVAAIAATIEKTKKE